MNRYAIYARFSSEHQRESSIEDQIRNCSKYAERQGWIASDALVFTDAAISGSISNARPGYQALIKAIDGKEIDTILVDSLDRLSRDQEELHHIHKRLKYNRITLIGVTDGYNGSDKMAKVNLTVKGLMAEMFLDDLKEKTRRGLEGCFLKGYAAGGKVYGYRSVPIQDATKLDAYGRPVIVGSKKEADFQESEVVLKVFHMYVEGFSPKQIAHHLNELRIPSPMGKSGGWSFSTICGDPKKACGILQNPIYIGKPIWNRSEKMKNPITEKRTYRMRPREEWIQVEVPELRIVSDELWNAARAREARRANQGPFYKQTIPKFLLSGLVKCGTCDRGYVVHRKNKLYCSAHLNMGNPVCRESRGISQNKLEATVIEALKERFLAKDYIEAVIDRVEKKLRARMKEAISQLPSVQRELKKAIQERDNLVKAIKAGIITSSTKNTLLAVEEKIRVIENQLSSARIPQFDFSSIPERIEKYIKGIEELWHNKPIQAREQMQRLVKCVIVEDPSGDAQVRIKGSVAQFLPSTFPKTANMQEKQASGVGTVGAEGGT